jgi:hypothetical protein
MREPGKGAGPDDEKAQEDSDFFAQLRRDQRSQCAFPVALSGFKRQDNDLIVIESS